MSKLQQLVLVVTLAFALLVSPFQAQITNTGVEITQATASADNDPWCPEPGNVWPQLDFHGTKDDSGEACAFHFNTGKDTVFISVVLAQGFMTTTARDDGKVHIRMGDGSRVNAKAGTFRYVAAYPGLNSVFQYQLEYAKGANEDPIRFEKVVVCDDCPAGTSPVPPNVASDGCPMFGGVWTQPIGDTGCRYIGPVVQDTIPSGWWAKYGSPPQDNKDPGAVITVSKASFYRR